MRFVNGLIASVSAEANRPVRRALIIGPNWIGDTVMAMPAVRAWRRRHPDARLLVAARRPQDELWTMHGAADEVLAMPSGTAGTLVAAWAIRRWRPDRVYVLLHSIRSTLLALSAGAPCSAMPGLFRRMLGFRVCSPCGGHQQFESADVLLGPGSDSELEAPTITIPEEVAREARTLLAGLPAGPRVAVMPGAARGPAKRWPAERFAEVARRLAAECGCVILALGSPDEAPACARLASAAGAAGRDLSGRTRLPVWAALLATSEFALANDSGGMHLATAVGRPGVAVFGATDPHKTGPLRPDWIVVRSPGAGCRNVGRRDADAIQRLTAVTADEVFEACRRLLKLRRPDRQAGGGMDG